MIEDAAVRVQALDELLARLKRDEGQLCDAAVERARRQAVDFLNSYSVQQSDKPERGNKKVTN